MAVITGTAQNDTLSGTADADLIQGLDGDDILSGLDGNDELQGGEGADRLDGGAGDDLLHGGAGNDSLTELAGTNDQMFGEDGDDRLTYQSAVGSFTALLDGGAGDDVLEALVSYDDFATMIGGSGRDRIIASPGDVVTIDAGTDADLVQVDVFSSEVEITLGAGVDLLVLTGNPFPSGVVTISDFVAGDAGDAVNLADYLRAGVGPVTDPFAAGQLRLVQDGADAILQLDPDGSFGPFQFELFIIFKNVSVSSLTAHNIGGYSPDGSAVPARSLSGSAALDFFTGDSGDDFIAGYGGRDVLYGGGGNDRIEGGDGDDELFGQFGTDILIGGAGNDLMDGGLGNDIYIVDDAGDVIAELAVGNARNVVYASVSYVLAAGSQIQVLSTSNQSGTAPLALVGDAVGQEIYGNAGANFLEGGGGTDYLFGFGGNDTYVVDGNEDLVAEAAAGGTDIVYARGSYTLSAGAEVEILSTISQGATTAIALIGNGLDQTIYGNAGANYLEGGGGGDVLIGLGGNDTYVVDSASDYVAEAVGGGADVVYAKVSYALASGQEVDILSTASQAEATAIDLTGNERDQAIYGNAGANLLNGAAGADYLMGFGGVDTFAFTTALGGGNVDHIADFLAADDTIALDDAVFTGLGVGALGASAFALGTAAGDADDRIVYDQASGRIWFDADGNGAGAAVLFAVLDGGPMITAGDFTVI